MGDTQDHFQVWRAAIFRQHLRMIFAPARLGSIAFCVGMMLLPPLTAIDAQLWICAGSADPVDYSERMMKSVRIAALLEVGASDGLSQSAE